MWAVAGSAALTVTFAVLAVAQALSYGFLDTADADTGKFGSVIAIFVPGLVLISLYNLVPVFIRLAGLAWAVLFLAKAVLISRGRGIFVVIESSLKSKK